MPVDIQTINDNSYGAVLKITGYYTASGSASNTKIVAPLNLSYANTTAGAVNTVSIERIVYDTNMSAGFVQLAWEGASSNMPIVSLSRSSGEFNIKMINNAASPTGNVNMWINAPASNDTFTIFLHLLKEAGFDAARNLYR